MPKPKIIAAATAGVLVLAAVAAFGYATFAGGGKADSYQDDFDAWNAKQGATLTAATDLPDSMFPTQGVTSYQDKQVLAAMTKACEQTDDQIDQAKKAADALPTLSGSNPLSRLNGDWKKAAEDSEDREKVVKAYTRAITELLERRARDCRFNVQYDQPNPASVAADKQIKANDVDAGSTVANGPGRTYTCGKDQVSCIPVDRSDLKRFLDGHSKFIEINRQRGIKVGNTTYDKSSYEPAAAEIKGYFAALATYKKADIATMRAFASDIDNDKLAAARKKTSRPLGDAIKKVSAALTKAYPELRDYDAVQSNPLFSEQFFSAIDTIEVRSIAKQRKAFSELN